MVGLHRYIHKQAVTVLSLTCTSIINGMPCTQDTCITSWHAECVLTGLANDAMSLKDPQLACHSAMVTERRATF